MTTNALRRDLPARRVDVDQCFASPSRRPRGDGVDGHCGNLARRSHGDDATTMSHEYRVRRPRGDGVDGRYASLAHRPRGVDAATSLATREMAEESASHRGESTSPPRPKDLCAARVDPHETTHLVRRVTYSEARGEHPSRRNSTGGPLRLVAREARDEEDWKRPRASLQGSAFAPSVTSASKVAADTQDSSPPVLHSPHDHSPSAKHV